MRLGKDLLSFLHPEHKELQDRSRFPVLPRSLPTRYPPRKQNLINFFAKVKRAGIFETVKLSSSEDVGRSGEKSRFKSGCQRQFLTHKHKVLSVVQVCRKGFDPATAGPDFTRDDLQQLELAARVLSALPFVK
jgi:hypothetical protein